MQQGWRCAWQDAQRLLALAEPANAGDTGHVWQNRFYSCPLDERHGWEALRYVELNPVRATLVEHPAEWRCQRARSPDGADDTGLIDLTTWTEK